MKKKGAQTLDPREVQAFDDLAQDWWKPDGAFRMLHLLNPVRLEFIWQQVSNVYGLWEENPLKPYTGLTMLDVGCGGGILTESLTRCGANLTGIDGSEKAIAAARDHAEQNHLSIEYHVSTVEEWGKKKQQYDVVLALEILEHVTDVEGFVKGVMKVTRPGGLVVFSTLNRTLKAYAVAILGAERLLHLLPKGTHDWSRFLPPSELAESCRKAQLGVLEIQGMTFSPWRGEFSLNKNVSVNYLLSARKSPQENASLHIAK